MAEQVTGTFDTKQIHELTTLNKLQGREELLIDNGDITLKVTVDTLLGYIRDQINASTGSGSSSGPSGMEYTGIHVIDEGEEDIPIETREKGHFYIRVQRVIEAQNSSGIPRLIKVSPNMQLRMIND